MSAQASNLSAYGCDIVIATSHQAINSTMRLFIAREKFPLVCFYYNRDDNGNPVEVDRETLMKQTNGTDPLNVKTWDKSQAAGDDITNLGKSRFLCAFEAEIGKPPGLLPKNMPDIIDFVTGDGPTVNFTLLCSRFTVVQATFEDGQITRYFNQSQPEDQCWRFTTRVPIKMITDDSNLPQAFRQQLASLDPDFRIQKFMLDLEKVDGGSSPDIDGVEKDSELYNVLNAVFIKAYCDALKAQGGVVLDYTVVQDKPDPSTLKIMDVDYGIQPFVDAGGQPLQEPADLYTLNYFCATPEVQFKPLRPLKPFNWNWFDNENDANQFSGIIAINRNTIARYFRTQLDDYIAANSLVLKITGSDIYSWSAEARFPSKPWIAEMPESGTTLLHYYCYDSENDQYGLNGWLGRINLFSNYYATLSVTNNCIVIDQHMNVTLQLFSLGKEVYGKLLDRTIKTVYEIAVDTSGNLKLVLHQPAVLPIDDSEDLTVSDTLNSTDHINDIIKNIKSMLEKDVLPHFKDMPLSLSTKFVFPAADAMSFSEVAFSDNQDLLVHIQYTNPIK